MDTADLLCSIGFDEVQTYSFISPKYYDKIRMPKDSALRKSVVISNPLGEDTSVMRTTALPSMMEVVARNNNMGNEKAALFEMASTYIPHENEKELPDQNKDLVLATYGKGDFFTLKGVCEKIFSIAGISGVEYVSTSDDPAFHPGRTAKILLGDKELGVIGQIHPLTAENYDISRPVYVAIVSFDTLFAVSSREKHYKALPKFPATTRDFSFVCEESLEVGKIFDAVRRAGSKLVEDVKLFDIYRGPQVGEGKKSVSIRVSLRASDRTLTVEEAEKVSRKILGSLEHVLGITIR